MKRAGRGRMRLAGFGKIARNFPSLSDFTHTKGMFGDDRWVYEDDDFYIVMGKELHGIIDDDRWGWEISRADMHIDLLAINLNDSYTLEECYRDLRDDCFSGRIHSIWYDDMRDVVFGSRSHKGGSRKALRKMASDFCYEAEFHLMGPVNDFGRASRYLTEDDMTRYLKGEYSGIPQDISSAVNHIEWILEDEDSGVIRLDTNREMSQDELDLISKWVSGQNSDGLGEGFEQQDFASFIDDEYYSALRWWEDDEPDPRDYEDEDDYLSDYGDWEYDIPNEDDYFLMCSFDWKTNPYTFYKVGSIARKKAAKRVGRNSMRKKASWGDFDNPVADRMNELYLLDYGEGDTMANQIAAAVNKLVFKWFNDGDVFDNAHTGLEGFANDISDCANWLYTYVPITKEPLSGALKWISEQKYEDILLGVFALTLCDEDLMSNYSNLPAIGSIYDCSGPFTWDESLYDEDEYEDEDGWW